MSSEQSIPFSVLDLSPIIQGSDAAQALRNSLDLARHAERLGYTRYWVAEHHNMAGIASAATSVVIAYLAGGTERIRVGSGGIMLPNHSPLVIAEQFGTLASLYPNRIDLGLGRAPGTDPRTAAALRRNPMSAERFPSDVYELCALLGDPAPDQFVRATPGQGTHVPIWLLGSSDFSARFAASIGAPFAFASHFAPDYLHAALDIYRTNFQPSEQLQKPYAMIGVNVFAADTDEEARRLMTSAQQQFISLRRGNPGPLKPPVDDIDDVATPNERLGVDHALRCSAVGSPETVRRSLKRLIEETEADEVMIAGQIFDHQARLRSFEIAAEAAASITKPSAQLQAA